MIILYCEEHGKIHVHRESQCNLMLKTRQFATNVIKPDILLRIIGLRVVSRLTKGSFCSWSFVLFPYLTELTAIQKSISSY